MTNAVAYLRVSTDKQADDGVSLDAQREAVEAYCKMRGLELIEVVVDAGVSAGKALADRDGGMRLLGLARSRMVGAVVTYKLDRLFRDCSDALDVTRMWDRREIALHLIDMGGQAIDTSTAMGRFFLTVMAGAAEMERNLVRERTSTAMRHKRSRLEYTGGKVRFGYRVSEDGATLIEEPGEQDILCAVKELRADGVSYRGISALLAKRGMLSRAGRPFTPNALLNMMRG